MKAISAAGFRLCFKHAIGKSGAKNQRALRALLDMETIDLEGENLMGLDEQIDALKKQMVIYLIYLKANNRCD